MRGNRVYDVFGLLVFFQDLNAYVYMSTLMLMIEDFTYIVEKSTSLGKFAINIGQNGLPHLLDEHLESHRPH